jgi:hypothetical protein
MDPADPEILALLLNAQPPVDPWFADGAPRKGLIEAVRVATGLSTQWGVRLVRSLSESEAWGADLWEGVTAALPSANLPDAEWLLVLQVLRAPGLLSEQANAVSRLLLDVVRSESSPMSAEVVGTMWQLSLDLFRALPEGAGPDADDTWLEWAINDPSGRIAMFWMEALSLARRRNALEQLPGWTTCLAQAMEDERAAGSGALSVIASQVHFMVALDPDWTKRILLPKFDWGQPAIATAAWQGYLTWGQLRPDLADALLDAYGSTSQHLEALGTLRERYLEHLAAVPFQTTIRPVEGWLERVLRQLGEADVVQWTESVGWHIDSLDHVGRDEAFTQWVRSYWSARLQGRPRILQASESKAMVDWAVLLDSRFADAVALVIESPAAGISTTALHHLEASHRVEAFPDLVAALLLHVLPGQPTDTYFPCDVTERLRMRLMGLISADQMASLTDALLRLGCLAPGP